MCRALLFYTNPFMTLPCYENVYTVTVHIYRMCYFTIRILLFNNFFTENL